MLLDPVGHATAGEAGGWKTLVIRSGAGAGAAQSAETLFVPDANHFTLAKNETTVTTICAILNEAATTIWGEQPAHTEFPAVKPGDPAPPPPIAPSSEEKTGEWNFLDGRPGESVPSLPAGETTGVTSGKVVRLE